jgi:hypothetical protein
MAAQASLLVRVGRDTVPADDGPALDAAIARSNAAMRVADLDDALNPSVLDPLKVHALLAALAALPPSALSPLGGHSLYLNAPDLPVRTTSPVTAASFAGLSGVEKSDVQGDTVLVRLAMPLDCDLARIQAAAARAAMSRVDAEVAALEARQHAASGAEAGALLPQLSAARTRRAAIAGAWRENAAAVGACRPGDKEAQAELAASEQAVISSAVPSGGGLE